LSKNMVTGLRTQRSRRCLDHHRLDVERKEAEAVVVQDCRNASSSSNRSIGFFAPRIRDLADKRLYIDGDAKGLPTLAGLIGGTINAKLIRAHWDEILRLAASSSR